MKSCPENANLKTGLQNNLKSQTKLLVKTLINFFPIMTFELSSYLKENFITTYKKICFELSKQMPRHLILQIMTNIAQSHTVLEQKTKKVFNKIVLSKDLKNFHQKFMLAFRIFKCIIYLIKFQISNIPSKFEDLKHIVYFYTADDDLLIPFYMCKYFQKWKSFFKQTFHDKYKTFYRNLTPFVAAFEVGTNSYMAHTQRIESVWQWHPLKLKSVKNMCGRYNSRFIFNFQSTYHIETWWRGLNTSDTFNAFLWHTYLPIT
ncbi:DDE Tnp IS1595 domain-containing protein [Aphis craccivora]|uniref:DDE Tnp IS1595 domain-containing protein n=1 Tax=Aphis craccivora TaxID=307492 RepID=A0A6G0ZMM1_APHCR|nr:DDE Tnp IS1595 domain-containing protein [Aphis craccivora]